MIRAFLALPLPDAMRNRLTIVQHTLRLDDPVPAENLHVTLAFLGEQPEPKLEEMHLFLTARPLPMPVLRLAGLGVFGGNAPRNIHACLAPDPRLTALQARVVQAARGAGIALERRKFVPHVTLARFAKHEVSAETLAAAMQTVGRVHSDAHSVPEMVLYRSTLRKDGAVYDALAEYPLTA
ncbi:RNA 2',3'-cyclic phosphodiesterase [Pararhodobacter sp.]|uniref:RNA 2',3'-cyclic phosphodiesterase n=1 Tax=Pararhodobacter sp. TaxID=2127056 RepID=UPI002B002997|nr:RNA 2',3'-cyclic phosphodiesterase [Pararhodobacter sp.]